MSDALWNLVGAAILLPTIYYAWRVLQHLTDHEQISLALFFLSDRSIRAFYTLFVAGGVYVVGITLETVEVITGTPTPFGVDQALKRVSLLGLLLFFRYTAQITRKRRAPLEDS